MAAHYNNKKNNNVTKLHYMPRFNIGILLLVVVFVYLIISVVLYMTKERVLTYEVSAGQLVSDNTFSGIIILDESVENSSAAGYVKYFLNDNERAGVETIIGIVDETGTVAASLTAASADSGISSTAINSIGHKLVNFAKVFDSHDYYETYNVLDNISATVNGYNAECMVENLENLIGDGNNFVHRIKPAKSTVVSCYVDSLCGITEDRVTAASFDQENYSITNLRNRELVGVGDALYRTINSDNWKIVFPLTENQVSQYAEVTSVKVSFLSQDITTTAAFSILYNADGSYGMISLSKYLVNFLDSRYVDFEISQNTASGLKIPISSVCEKEFFTIPNEYGYIGGDDASTGFILLTYDTQGNQTRKFIEATYYADIDGYYYVNKDIFSVGDCIVKPPSENEISYDDQKYIIGTVATLKGAYCINKGYCQFRQVSIIDRNDEYYIIERGTTYGLSIYDYIILNADMVTENQIMY